MSRCTTMVFASAALSASLCLGVASGACAVSGWPVLKTYEGEFLRRVRMPLGGIGTGTISLAGRGALVDWEIRNRPDKGFVPEVQWLAPSFLIRTEEADGRVSLRLLEGPLDTELYEGGEGAGTFNHGFPRFARSVFRVAYPLAQVGLDDPSMPVAATLEAMNPLVPHDVAASSLPAALLRWRIVNRTAHPLKVSVLGFLVNPASGASSNAVVTASGLKGVAIGSADVAPTDTTLGRVALVVPESCGAVSAATVIASYGWRVRLDRFVKAFCETGRASDLADPDAKGTLPAVALSVSFDLPAQTDRAVPFALGWRFPHRRAWTTKYKDVFEGPFDPKLDVGNFYARRFPDEVGAAAELLGALASYERRTVEFVQGVLSSAAPAVVREAALFNLSTFRTETCFRTADGHFYGWEGCFDRAGSCLGSCTHVWGYEHALVDLWPELARDMIETQYGVALSENGHMSYRIGLPRGPDAWKTIAAADGQMQCAIKAFEYWKQTGDTAWLKRLYPRIRRSIEFCWIAGGWDADRDGVMEGCQHNTMDVEYYGPNPQMEFLYVAALKALAEMSVACGEGAFASRCRTLAARGQAWTEKNLFNGDWYEHRVVPPKVRPAVGISYGETDALSNPDFQLAAGCLVDQLLGDSAARHVGLGPVADEAHANRALDTILAKCASSNVGPRYNCGRSYAFPEEPALKMAWYPDGRMPKKPFPYYGETMTGFEYVVAANLVHRGRLAEAEAVVRNIRSRYDGRKRNPFDEAECGHHYVRALAAWSAYVDWPWPSRSEKLNRAEDFGAEILWERVIVRDNYVGWPTVCRRANGELLAVYSGDRSGHVTPWGKVRLVRSADGGETWSAPETIVDTVLDDRDAGLVELKNGDLALFCFNSVFFGEYRKGVPYGKYLAALDPETVRTACGSWCALSHDGGRTWDAPVRTHSQAPHGGIQLKDGRLVMVGRVLAAPDVAGSVLAEESRDGGRTWRILKVFDIPDGIDVTQLHEPHVAEAADGTLVCQLRSHQGVWHVCQCESHDGGRTWTPLRDLPLEVFPAKCVPPHLLRLKDGRLLSVTGSRRKPSFGERAFWSSDGGRTWGPKGGIFLSHGVDDDLGYPSSVELDDGTILTVFYQSVRVRGSQPVLKAVKWRLPGVRN